MEPTTPQPTTPGAGEPLVEYVRTQRQNAGYGLMAFSVLLLALAGFLALKAFRAPVAAETTPDKSVTDPFDPESLQPTKGPTEAASPRSQYMLGWIFALGASLILGASGAWLLAGVPAADVDRQRTESRVLLLAVGGLIGALLIVAGILYFYIWSDSLTKWIDKREIKEARWVLIPLLVIVAGVGLVFAAIQPARAEERNNSLIRRLVYGSNFALTALLLVVALVVVNVVIAREVPNKLDTTETGFYSLSENTRALLTRLEQPVNAYAVLPEGSDRALNDIRQLLLAYQEASDGKFKARFLNRVADRTELAGLRSKYPKLDLALDQRNVSGAVLLTTGEEEKRNEVIPDTEFFTFTPQGDIDKFQGESELYKKVAFLADSQTKPIVYFTQGHGELDIGGQPGAPASRSASRLKAYLEKNYLDVRPLTLPADNPAVPGDAAVVVIAEPLNPFPDPAIAALRKYMTDPAKKGKLVFLSGAVAGPDGKMLKTGLEPFLAELNVRLGNQFIYSIPTRTLPAFHAALVGFSASAEQNPILQAISNVSPRLEFVNPREVETQGTNQALQATSLMLTVGPTWLEDERPADLEATLQELVSSPELQRRKQLSRDPRSVAVIVSEQGSGRAVVFGNSYFVSDDYARRIRGNPLMFDLFGVTIDWLRDRQASVAVAGIEEKKYKEYTFPAPGGVDFTRLLWLPLGLALLVVVGLGAGVWVSRRR